jgi:hypothetical protein
MCSRNFTPLTLFKKTYFSHKAEEDDGDYIPLQLILEFKNVLWEEAVASIKFGCALNSLCIFLN